MTQGKYDVTLAKRADIMLLEHTRFIANVSTTATRRLLAEFRKIDVRLTENPYQFPYADEVDVQGITPNTYRKCLLDKRYKVLFLIEGNDVYIDAIIDCRQENANLFN